MRLPSAARWAIAITGTIAVLAGATACTPPSEQEPEARVLVISDELAVAAGEESWPRLLDQRGFQVDVDDAAGTSWLTASPASVADRVARASTDIVVIALGVEQPNAPDELLDAAFRNGLDAAASTGARVVVLSPLEDGGDWVVQLKAQAQDVGAVFADVSVMSGDLRDPVAQSAIAERVAESLQ